MVAHPPYLHRNHNSTEHPMQHPMAKVCTDDVQLAIQPIYKLLSWRISQMDEQMLHPTCAAPLPMHLICNSIRGKLVLCAVHSCVHQY
jgi:hypothetical protein